MDFETEEKVDENEIDALGITKKDDDSIEDEDTETTEVVDEEEKENVDEGIFGDDKELEDYMLAGYDDRD